MPRYAQLLVAGDLIASWFTRGTPRGLVVDQTIPADARLAGAYTAHPGLIGLIFEHPSFPEAGKGADAAMLPMLASPTFQLAICPEPGHLPPSAN